MAYITKLPRLLILTTLVSVSLAAQQLPSLPEASRDAVSLTTIARGKTYVFNAGGQTDLAAPSQRKSWLLTLGDSQWQQLADIPSNTGQRERLAAAASVLEQQFFIFSGYSRTNDSISTLSDSYRLSPISRMYSKIPDMPVPVHGSVAVSLAGRYIFLIGGAYQHSAVNLVQVFDNFTQKWQLSTALPVALTGHVAALLDDTLLVCGGMQQHASKEGTDWRPFRSCFSSVMTNNPFTILWRQVDLPAAAPWYPLSAHIQNINGSAMIVLSGGRLLDGTQNERPENWQFAPDERIWLFQPKGQKWYKGHITKPVVAQRFVLPLQDKWYKLGGVDASTQSLAQFTLQEIQLLPDQTP